MEHSCQKCGAAVEDGVAFCPNCNAPQIRISAGILNRPAPPPPAPDSVDNAATGFQSSTAVPAQPVVETPVWSDAVPGAVVAGALLAAASLVPFAAPLLLMLAAGGFSVVFYSRRSQTRLTPRAAARVGAMGGLVGFIFLVVMLAVTMAASGGRMVEMLRQAMIERMGPNPPQQAQEVMEKLMTPGGMATVIAFGLLVFLVVLLVASAAGGALLSSLLGRRKGPDR